MLPNRSIKTSLGMYILHVLYIFICSISIRTKRNYTTVYVKTITQQLQMLWFSFSIYFDFCKMLNEMYNTVVFKKNLKTYLIPIFKKIFRSEVKVNFVSNLSIVCSVAYKIFGWELPNLLVICTIKKVSQAKSTRSNDMMDPYKS